MDTKRDRAEEALRAWTEAMREAFAQKSEDCIIPGQMDRYVLGELSEEEAHEITLHMAFCGYCRQQYIRSTIRAQEDKGIFKFSALRAWADEGITEAQKVLTDLTQWLQDLFKPLEPQPVRVHGVVRARGAVRTRGSALRPQKEAKVLDKSGKPIGEIVTFTVCEGPKIEGGKFILKLQTSETEYQGYIINVALKKEKTSLELYSAPIKKAEGDKSLVVEVAADFGELELRSTLIPLDFIEITMQKTQQAMAYPKQPDVTEIVWLGRGGQGAITLANVLAGAALREGLFAQAFPEYGPERSGALVKAYNRIARKEIRLHYAIYEPNVLVVLDPHLLDLPAADVFVAGAFAGLRADGVLVVNSSAQPQEIRRQTGHPGKIISVDADSICREASARFAAVPILGAALHAVNLVSLDQVKNELEAFLRLGLSQHECEANLMALELGYERAVIS